MQKFLSGVCCHVLHQLRRHADENDVDRIQDAIQFDVADIESVETVPGGRSDVRGECGCPFRDRVRSGGSVPVARH